MPSKPLVIALTGVFAFFISFSIPHSRDDSSAKHNTLLNSEFIPGEILIQFSCNIEVIILKRGKGILTNNKSLNNLLNDIKVIECESVFPEVRGNQEKNNLTNIFKLTISDNNSLLSIIDELNKNSSIVYAEPNYVFTTCDTFPNDPLYTGGSQWYVDAVFAPAAWDSVSGDTSQVIAILDTGVDWDHPDLYGSVWINPDELPNNGLDDDGNGYIDDIRGWDWINQDNNPNDDNSHGTHVAGIAAAESNNGIGITGISWGARIMPLKVLQSSGKGSAGDIANGIYYAWYNGATVINMSLGSYSESLTVKAALETAYSSCVLVAAAGNDGYPISFLKMYPAGYQFVIGVQAWSQGGGKASFSNFDPDPTSTDVFDAGLNYEVYAPGENIISTFPFGGYNNLNGTSMAAPIVSAAAALLKVYKPSISNEEILARLIQSSSGACLNIYTSMTLDLVPELQLVSHTIKDTMPDCNNDGTVDDGETITIAFEVKNIGGWADSIYAEIELADPADTIFAEIIDNTAFVGDVGIYGTMNTNDDPFVIHIDTTTPYKQNISLVINIQGLNTSGISPSISFEVTNAFEIKGVLDTIMTLYPGILWVTNGGFRIDPGGGLNFLPGSHLIVEEGFSNNGGVFLGHGTPDSIIMIEGGIGFGTADFSYTRFINGGYAHGDGFFDNCVFENPFRSFNDGLVYFTDCQFIGGFFEGMRGDGSIIRCNFVNTTGNITEWWLGNRNYYYCNFSGIDRSDPFFHHADPSGLKGNNFICKAGSKVYGGFPNSYFLYLPPLYWGTTNTDKIDDMIWDFWDDPGAAIAIYKPILTQPHDSAHGVIWKVEINGIDPQDEILDPLGPGWAKFDVYFNKCVDTSYTPLLTFGNYMPYDEHIVEDSALWSADSSVWTAWYEIGLETGDGINVIKVSGAVDTAGWEVPPEFNNRFKFVIQAASSASLEFQAVAGLDKVELEWPGANTNDILGYNLYRMTLNDDLTYSDSILVNNVLIMDTVYCDSGMVTGVTYYYFYKIVGTDLLENDRSKIVSATPYSTVKGDANGDLTVDVLDITTVVSYILNQNPQPFYDYAADVNNDQVVNVVDIVGIIQIISGRSLFNSPKSLTVNGKSSLFLDENDIILDNLDELVALQFELILENSNPVLLAGIAKGFEMSWIQNGNKITCIIFSLNQHALPAAKSKLLTCLASASLRKGIGVSKELKTIDLMIEIPNLSSPDHFNCIISPNPVRTSARFAMNVPHEGLITIDILDQIGRVIEPVVHHHYDPGKYQIEWKTDVFNHSSRSSGIYYARITYSPLNANEKGHEQLEKIIIIK